MPTKKAKKSTSFTELGSKAYLEPYDVARLEKAANNLRDRLLIKVTISSRMPRL